VAQELLPLHEEAVVDRLSDHLAPPNHGARRIEEIDIPSRSGTVSP
jgi:hypothetical protein